MLNRVGALGHGSKRQRATTRAVLEIHHILAHHLQHRCRLLPRHPQGLERLGRRELLGCLRHVRVYRRGRAGLCAYGLLPVGVATRDRLEPVGQRRGGGGVLPPQHRRCRHVPRGRRRRQGAQPDGGARQEQADAANGKGEQQPADQPTAAAGAGGEEVRQVPAGAPRRPISPAMSRRRR